MGTSSRNIPKCKKAAIFESYLQNEIRLRTMKSSFLKRENARKYESFTYIGQKSKNKENGRAVTCEISECIAKVCARAKSEKKRASHGPMKCLEPGVERR